MLLPVDIVLPCYNPNDAWHEELLEFYSLIKDQYQVSFILVNDGSLNGKIAGPVELLQKTVPLTYISYSENKGKGYALRQGVAAAKQPCVVYTDVDFPFTYNSMLAVIKAITTGQCDIAAGFRNQNYYDKKMSFYRRLLSKSFRFFTRNVLGMATSDTQCGLKGFNQKGKEKFMATRINRYLFDFEFIYKSGKDKTASIKAVEVHLKDNVVFSRMKLKILLQESINLLYILIFRRK